LWWTRRSDLNARTTIFVKNKKKSGHAQQWWTRKRGDLNAMTTAFVKNTRTVLGIYSCAGLGEGGLISMPRQQYS
jgi:hypothetical protein